MTSKEHDVRDAARIQLDTAIRLYLEREDYYSVVTLAGASEEILGRLLPDGTHAFGIFNKIFVKAQQLLGGQPSDADAEKADENSEKALDEDAEKAAEKAAEKWVADRSNDVRNWLKHLKSKTHSFDAKQEAFDMVNRAIDNYWRLNEDLTPLMRRFQDEGTSD